VSNNSLKCVHTQNVYLDGALCISNLDNNLFYSIYRVNLPFVSRPSDNVDITATYRLFASTLSEETVYIYYTN